MYGARDAKSWDERPHKGGKEAISLHPQHSCLIPPTRVFCMEKVGRAESVEGGLYKAVC